MIEMIDRKPLIAALLVAALLSSAVAADQDQELTVFAAASLSVAFEEMGQLYKSNSTYRAIMNFDGSQMLRTQIEQGAYADVFASANKKHMEALQAGGFIDNSTVRPFLKNSLAVLLPKDNPGRIHNLSDLARPGLRLVIGNSQVPVGQYSRQILDKMAEDPDFGPEYRDRVLANVMSEETNVNLVVSKVALGEADAGLAYISDVSPKMTGQISTLPIPDRYNIVAEYYIGVLQGSRLPEQAWQFIELVLSEQGQSVLKRHGFSPIGSSNLIQSAPGSQADILTRAAETAGAAA